MGSPIREDICSFYLYFGCMCPFTYFSCSFISKLCFRVLCQPKTLIRIGRRPKESDTLQVIPSFRNGKQKEYKVLLPPVGPMSHCCNCARKVVCDRVSSCHFDWIVHLKHQRSVFCFLLLKWFLNASSLHWLIFILTISTLTPIFLFYVCVNPLWLCTCSFIKVPHVSSLWIKMKDHALPRCPSAPLRQTYSLLLWLIA